MNRNEVMDWIDNANDKELNSPPSEVRAILTLDQECMNYYQVSLNLKQPNRKVDLWNKFQRTVYQRGHTAQEKEEPKSLFSTKWLWRLSTAGASAAIALVLILFPFSWKQKTEVDTQDIVYSDPIELTLEIVSDFFSTVRSVVISLASPVRIYPPSSTFLISHLYHFRLMTIFSTLAYFVFQLKIMVDRILGTMRI